MYATLRRYTPTSGSMTPSAVEKLGHQLQDNFLPLARKIEGFHGYYALAVGDRELLTISVFETSEGCAESTRRAAEFVAGNPLPFEVSAPEVIEGSVIAAAEAGVTA